MKWIKEFMRDKEWSETPLWEKTIAYTIVPIIFVFVIIACSEDLNEIVTPKEKDMRDTCYNELMSYAGLKGLSISFHRLNDFYVLAISKKIDGIDTQAVKYRFKAKGYKTAEITCYFKAEGTRAEVKKLLDFEVR